MARETDAEIEKPMTEEVMGFLLMTLELQAAVMGCTCNRFL